jgi:hypothetical protein
MPLFNPPAPIANIELLSILPDPDGDWLRLGSGPWHRVRIWQQPDGLFRYALEVRLATGDPREVASDVFSDTP